MRARRVMELWALPTRLEAIASFEASDTFCLVRDVLELTIS